MKLIFEQFSDVVLSVIGSVVVIAILASVFIGEIYPKSVEAIEINVNDNKTIKDKQAVSIRNFSVKDAVIEKDEEFNIENYVTATNTKGEDIRSFVSLNHDIDTKQIGENQVTYFLRYNGQTMVGKAKVIVQEGDISNEEYD